MIGERLLDIFVFDVVRNGFFLDGVVLCGCVDGGVVAKSES